MASFEQARSVATDGLGFLYVADSGRDVIVRMDYDGRILATFGGPGIEAGQFDDPFDIDPTNGLVIIIADAGNGRIQRFSREFMNTGIIPVGLEDATETANQAGEKRQYLGYGRPVAVVSSMTGELFAVDGDENVVLKWDRSGKLMRRIGGYDAGDGTLSRPVSISLGPEGNLFVADAGREEVLVYDQYGSYIRAIGSGIARDIRSVAVHDNDLWVVLPGRLLVFETGGRLKYVMDVKVGTALVDVAHGKNHLFLLTENTLYRTEILL